MSSVGLFLYVPTEGFVPYIEDKLVQGWNNNSFIGGAHVGEDSPQIQEILNKYDGLYYQWDMGIQCKYEAGVYKYKDTMRFWTTIESARNVEFFRLYFQEKGPINVTSDFVMSYWDGWPEDKFKKYASFHLFDGVEERTLIYGVAYTKDQKIVPLNFSIRTR